MTPVSPIRQNVIANFAGKAWSGVMSIVFVPLYLKFLGIEAYGLIGVFASLMVLISVLDLGLSTTLNRQLAALSTSEEAGQESRDLVRTLEIVYWGAGVLIGTGLIALAPAVARHWLNVDAITVGTAEQALMIMGLVVACQWPASLYMGGLMGLQKQVLLNGIQSAAATVQAGGAVLVLWLVAPTIQAYFLWQILVSFLQTLILARYLWRSLPGHEENPRFRKNLFTKNWRFAAGMTGIAAVSAVLTQLDKVILSRVLPLGMFGYYILAYNIASTLSYLSAPVFSALFPRFSQQVAGKEQPDLSSLYHKGCQIISVLVLPAAITVAFFAREILTLWLKNPATATQTSPLLSLIIVGTALNSLMVLPLALQLAHGWTRLSFYKNVIAVLLFLPSLTWMVARYGSTGAAIVWIALNAAYCLIEIPIMHRRVLRGEARQWYVVDVGLPLLVILATSFLSRMIMPSSASVTVVFFWVSATLVLSFLFSGLASPSTREWLKINRRDIA